MWKTTSSDYAKYIDIDLEKKPVNQSIDQMLTRLEEFETMLILVQQERCNSIGLTGSLTETMDYQKDLNELCLRIDAIEDLTAYIKKTMSVLENKMNLAEEHFGLKDNTTKLKSFFLPLFKKNTLEPIVGETDEATTEFSTEKFFSTEEQEFPDD